MAWTDAKVEILKTLWADGLTARQIAGELGVTKNSVIGKAYRLGLLGRLPDGRRIGPRKRKPRNKVVTPKPRLAPESGFYWASPEIDPPMPPTIALPWSKPIPFHLRRMHEQCSLIFGEPTYDAPCCGAQVIEGSEYCAAHYPRTVVLKPKTKAERQEYYRAFRARAAANKAKVLVA